MLWKIILIIILLLMLFGAVRFKVNAKRMRVSENVETATASPASVALGELVAIAGGIYLSLVLLKTFLKLSLPESVSILEYAIDPLALAALAIALLQPIVIVLYYRLSRKY